MSADQSVRLAGPQHECGRTASDAAALDGPRGPARLVGLPSGEVLVQDGADGGRGLGVPAVTGGPADQPVGYDALLLLRIAFTAAVGQAVPQHAADVLSVI